ncbi:GNAT family N-acetyltransferase [Paenibacillus sp. M1]|uniref:GNAT family N-acetyltransferase n=1 Tax=Paenibacillus haidiansis TaxID=1574488 RepID=A0ABU7VTK8_9BACL
MQLIELNHELLEGTGSYCLRSRKNSPGYLAKNHWLHDRLGEGLKYVQLYADKKQVGFIEYTDAEYSSRVVYADNYLVIHCLWVSETGKGYGTELIRKCIADAAGQGKHGVAVVTNQDTAWAPGKEIFMRNGFIPADSAPYGFELLVHKFSEGAPSPYFPSDWEARLARYDNLTVLRTFQCPYLDVATSNVIEGAARLGIKAEIRELASREELMALSPTPYGVFAVVYQGRLISYHRLTVNSVIKKLSPVRS